MNLFTLFKIQNHLLKQNWKFIGEGRHRRVYIRNNVVIKIPISKEGRIANIKEYYLYKKCRYIPDCHYAPCRLIKNKFLMMKALKEYDSNFPDWANTLCDGPQVGIDKNGKLLAYDYSDEYF